MPVPRSFRTLSVVCGEIDAITQERDEVLKSFKVRLVELNREYDTVVGVEAAQKKYDSMDEAEKTAFVELLEGGN